MKDTIHTCTAAGREEAYDVDPRKTIPEQCRDSSVNSTNVAVFRMLPKGMHYNPLLQLRGLGTSYMKGWCMYSESLLGIALERRGTGLWCDADSEGARTAHAL